MNTNSQPGAEGWQSVQGATHRRTVQTYGRAHMRASVVQTQTRNGHQLSLMCDFHVSRLAEAGTESSQYNKTERERSPLV